MGKENNCKCTQCGVEFYSFPCWIRRGGGKFCSRHCKDEYQKGKTPSEETKMKMSISQKGKHASLKIKHWCLFCGSKFYTIPSVKGVYCSRKCKGKDRIGKSVSEKTRKLMSKSQIERNLLKEVPSKISIMCRNCNKEFYIYPSDLLNNKKFCSNKCKYDYQRIDIVSICEFCGKVFHQCPSRNNKFCSRDCWRKSRIGYSTNGDKIEDDCKCLMCGKGFHKATSVRNDNRGKFCSRRCKDKFQSGEKSPGWKGGVSFGKYCNLFNHAFKEKIREKFDRKCFLCGKTEEKNKTKLSVHHVDYFKASICRGRDWSFVPLCNSCHAKTGHNRHIWFNTLINYWVINSEINFNINYII